MNTVTPPNLITETPDTFIIGISKWIAIGVRKDYLGKYNDYYYAARDYQQKSLIALISAQKELDKNNLSRASSYIKESNTDQRIWHLYDSAANETWQKNLDKAKDTEFQADQLINSAAGTVGDVVDKIAGDTPLGMVGKGLSSLSTIVSYSTQAALYGASSTSESYINDKLQEGIVNAAEKIFKVDTNGTYNDAMSLYSNASDLLTNMQSDVSLSTDTMQMLSNELSANKSIPKSTINEMINNLSILKPKTAVQSMVSGQPQTTLAQAVKISSAEKSISATQATNVNQPPTSIVNLSTNQQSIDQNNDNSTQVSPPIQQPQQQKQVSNPAPYMTLTSEYGGLEYGGRTTLHWSSSNANSCTASGSWSGDKALSGSESIGPLYASQLYTLTCVGPGGLTSQYVTVSVSMPSQPQEITPSAPTLSFSITPGWVNSGETVKVSWSSTNTSSCSASGGWSGERSTSGYEFSSPIYAAQIFSMTCTGPGGSISRNSSVGIQNAPTITVVDTLATTQGKMFNLSGSKFTRSGGVTLHFSKPDGSFYPEQHANADSYGNLVFSWTVPSDAIPGASSVLAIDDTNGMQTQSIGFKIVEASKLAGDLTLTVTPTSGSVGTAFTISGANFTPNSADIIRFVKPDTMQYPPQQPAADSSGNLNFDWNPPNSAAPGPITVWVLDNATGRRSPEVTIEITP